MAVNTQPILGVAMPFSFPSQATKDGEGSHIWGPLGGVPICNSERQPLDPTMAGDGVSHRFQPGRGRGRPAAKCGLHTDPGRPLSPLPLFGSPCQGREKGNSSRKREKKPSNKSGDRQGASQDSAEISRSLL